MNIPEILSEWISFFPEQEKSYQVNLIRVASQNFLIWLVIPVQSIYLTVLGASASQVGWITGGAGIVGGLISFLTGMFIHKHGIKVIFLFETMVIAVGGLLLARAVNLRLAVLGIIVFLSFWYGISNLCRVICGSCLKNTERATGMQLCDTLSAVPRIIAPTIGGVLVTILGGYTASGIRPLYLLQFVGFCLISLFIWRLFEDPEKIKKIKNRVRNKRSNIRNRFHRLFGRAKKLKRWVLLRVFGYIPWYAALIYVPLFAKEVKGADPATLGYMFMAMWLCTLLFALPMGTLADRFGRKRITVMLITVYVFSILLLIASPNRLMLIISGFLQGTLMLSLVTQAAMGIELIPLPFIGEYLGFLGVIRGILAAISPIIVGTLWNIFNPFYAFYFVAASSLLILPILVTMPETLEIE